MSNYAITIKRENSAKNSYRSTSIFPASSLFRESRYVVLDCEIGDRTKLCKVYDYFESEEVCELKVGTLYVTFTTDTEFNTEVEPIDSIYYNKITNKTTGSLDHFDIENVPDLYSLSNIMSYIDSITKNVTVVHNYLKKFSNKYFSANSFTNYMCKEQYALKNILNIVQNNMLEAERFINSGQEKFLTKNIPLENFKLTSGTKKLSQTVGLPQFALTKIKSTRIEGALEALTNLNEIVDGNELRILLELIEDSKNLLTLNRLNSTADEKTRKLEKFINGLSFLLDKKRKNKYKLQDVLNYVLRQEMFWIPGDSFEFPLETMNIFVDYVSMSETADLKYEKYPQDIRKMHDIVLTNISNLNPEKDVDFINAVSNYKKYEMELKDGYSFIIPKNIKALIQEGNDLHHCIGAYVDKIINNESIIFFMRKTSEINVPFVTVEINEALNITEIKGIYNEEPEADIIKIAKKWAGIIKR